MVLRMKNFNILGFFWKLWFLYGGGGGSSKTKTNIERRDGRKRGELGLFADLSGDLARKQWVVFLREEVRPQCTLWWYAVKRQRGRGLHCHKCNWRICDLILAANIESIGQKLRVTCFRNDFFLFRFRSAKISTGTNRGSTQIDTK